MSILGVLQAMASVFTASFYETALQCLLAKYGNEITDFCLEWIDFGEEVGTHQQLTIHMLGEDEPLSICISLDCFAETLDDGRTRVTSEICKGVNYTGKYCSITFSTFRYDSKKFSTITLH